MDGYIAPDAASVVPGELPGNGLVCIGIATLSIEHMNNIPSPRGETPPARGSLLLGHARHASEQAMPARTPRDEVQRNATATLSNAGLASTGQPDETGYVIDEKRQAELDLKLAAKIRNCEQQLAALKRSPRKSDPALEEALKAKLAALKEGLHGSASVMLPSLKATHTKENARKSRSLFRLSLSPRSGVEHSEHVEAPQTARVEIEKMQKERRYKKLMATRVPLVEKLRGIDRELNVLAEELHFPPPKPAADVPVQPRVIRTKSQNAQPRTQL